MSDDVSMTASQWILGALAFAAEIALVIAAAISAYRLAAHLGTAPRWIAAIGTAILVLAIWSRWMSPNAELRLPTVSRVLLAAALFALVAIALWASGSATAALLLASAGIVTMAIAQPMLSSSA